MASANKLLERAGTLLAKGGADDADRARSLVLEAASGPEADPRARRLYEEWFPLTPAQQNWIDGTLAKLGAGQPAVRAKAARELSRAAHKEVTKNQREQIADPRCLDYIIPALRSPDAKVAEAAVAAVGRAAEFYHRDWRAWEPVSAFLKTSNKSTRWKAVQAAAYLGREDAVDAILPLLDDPVEQVRNEAGRMLIVMARSKDLSLAMRKRLSARFADDLASDHELKRLIAVNMLREFNVPASIEPLRTAVEREPDAELRDRIAWSIRCLEAGDPELPM